MSDVTGEDRNSFYVRNSAGRVVRVAKTAATMKRFGKPAPASSSAKASVETDMDFGAWDKAKLANYDKALQFLEMAKQDPSHRAVLMDAGGLQPAKALQMAKYRAWRYGLNKTGGDDAKLRGMGLTDDQIKTARSEVSAANDKFLSGTYDIFVPKAPEPTQAPPAKPVQPKAKPVPAAAPPPAAAPQGEGLAPTAPPAPAAAPAAIPAEAPAAAPAPIAPAAPLVQPQPVMTLPGEGLPAPTPPMTDPNQLLAAG